MKKKCNCKQVKKVQKLVETIDDINKTSSKGYSKKRPILNRMILKLLKYTIYIILIALLILLLIPIIIPFVFYKRIIKKPIIIKLPYDKLVSKK